MRFLVLAALLSLHCFDLVALNPDDILRKATEAERVAKGKESFQNRCSGCHGANADGLGPASPMLNPRPRNLISGGFKFRSTPASTMPTDADLMRTLNQGVLGTSMPSFSDVPVEEKRAIISYIKTLRPEWAEPPAERMTVQLPPPPKEIFSTKTGLLAAAKRGKTHYEAGCLSCHGNEGRGDGPAAAEMVDNDDVPIRPANLRLPYIKSGRGPADVFRTITVGLDGAPMPAYEAMYSQSQRWDLVAYVYYLRGLESGRYAEGDKIQ